MGGNCVFVVVLSIIGFCLCTPISKAEMAELTLSAVQTYPSLSDVENATIFVKLLERNMHSPQVDREEKMGATVSAFPCEPFAPSTLPTSVHHLTVADIKVVGALGDSLTAGFGAEASSLLNLFTDYRGVSWSGGGKGSVAEGVTTNDNFLKLYNPALFGFATGRGDAASSAAKFNVAVTGAVAADMLAQTGGTTPEQFRERLAAALDVLRSVPRTFVNLVAMPDVTILKEASSGICSLLHPFECSCAVGSASEQEVTRTAQITFNSILAELAREERYQNSDVFTVVYQPFLSQIHLPQKDGKADLSYFAPDCFHLSQKGQGAGAVGLWNNIIEAPGRKLTTWVPMEPIECPAAGSFIPTYKN